jgi:hypothetical protein
MLNGDITNLFPEMKYFESILESIHINNFMQRYITYVT